jgi:hypothetical protein
MPQWPLVEIGKELFQALDFDANRRLGSADDLSGSCEALRVCYRDETA